MLQMPVWNNRNIHPFLVGVQICIATMKIKTVVPQEDMNQSTLRSSYTTLKHPKDTLLSQGYLFNHVHHCFVNDIQKLKTS